MSISEKRIEKNFTLPLFDKEAVNIKVIWEVKSIDNECTRRLWFENGDGIQHSDVDSAVKAYFNNLYFKDSISLEERDALINEYCEKYFAYIDDLYVGDYNGMHFGSKLHSFIGMFYARDEIDILFLKRYFYVKTLDKKPLNEETVENLVYPNLYVIERSKEGEQIQMTSYDCFKNRMKAFLDWLDEKKSEIENNDAQETSEYAVQIYDENDEFFHEQIDVFGTYEEAKEFIDKYDEELPDGRYLDILVINYDADGEECGVSRI